MVPFKETINTKQELIDACKKGFEDTSYPSAPSPFFFSPASLEQVRAVLCS